MFGSIGITELIVIFVVALIVIGPKRLPDLAKTLGKTLRDFKRATSDFQESISLDEDFDIEPSRMEDSAHAGNDLDDSEKNRIDPGGEHTGEEHSGEDAAHEEHPGEDAADKEDSENEPADSAESSSPSEGSGDSADEPPKERTQTT